MFKLERYNQPVLLLAILPCKMQIFKMATNIYIKIIIFTYYTVAEMFGLMWCQD